jgi:membrane protein involved in colicin uptake
MAAGALEIELILKADRARGEIEATRLRIDALQKQVDEFNTTGARMERIKDGFLSVAGAVTGVVVAVGAAARGIAELAAQHDTHTRAVARLGVAYDLVQASTNGVVTAEQALHVQQSLAQAGHALTAEQLAIVTRRAREYAVATGTDLNQALDQVTDALRGMEAEGLRRFGLSVNSNRTYTENLTAALNQMRDSFHGAAPAGRTFGEDIARTDRTMSEFAGRIATAVANMTHLRDIMAEITDHVSGDFDRRVSSLQQDTAAIHAHNVALARVTAAREGRDGYRSTQINFQGRDLSSFSTADLNELANQATAGQQHIDDTLARIDARNAGAIVDRINSAARTNIQSARDTFDQQVNARGAAMGDDKISHTAHPAGPQHLTAAQEIQRRLDDERKAEEASARQAEITRAQSLLDQQKAEDEAARTRLDAERAANDQRLDEEQRSNAAMLSEKQRANEAALMAAQRQNDEQNSLSTQLSQRFAAHAELHETRAQGMAGLVEGAYNTMTSAMETHIAALLQGKETVAEAMAETAKAVVLGLATQAITKAIFETAEGVANIARYAGSEGTDAGALAAATTHFASAGIYAVIGGASAAGYVGLNAATSGGTSKASSPSSPGAAASTRGSGGHDGGSGGNTYVINVNGFAMHHEEVQDAVAGVLGAYHDRGRTVRGIPYRSTT